MRALSEPPLLSFTRGCHAWLAFHPAGHVEGSTRLATQRHLQEIVFTARLDGLAQFGRDLKEAIGRAEAANALVRPLVVVIFSPELNALASRFEAVELGPGEELLPQSFP